MSVFASTLMSEHLQTRVLVLIESDSASNRRTNVMRSRNGADGYRRHSGGDRRIAAGIANLAPLYSTEVEFVSIVSVMLLADSVQAKRRE